MIQEAKNLYRLRRYSENKVAFIKLQQEWKTVGVIPKDKFFKISREFKKLGNNYFERLNEEVRYNLGGGHNGSGSGEGALEVKRRIYDRSRVVYELPADDAYSLVKLLQDEWKDSGFVPKKLDPEMFNDFYKNCEIRLRVQTLQ